VIRVGILGAAKIAPMALIDPARSVPGLEVSSIAARDQTRARAFAFAHKIPKVAKDYQAIIDDPMIDAVYIPLPISAHATWTIQALKAGKHVLCEKSLAANRAQALRMRDVSLDQGLVLMDAFHYRYHPLFEAAVAEVRGGRLGAIQRIDASFQIQGPVPVDDIRRIYAQGGGVLMDIGCYPVSWVRHLMASEPDVVTASAVTDPANVDVEMTAELCFKNGPTAGITGSMQADQKFKAEIVVTGLAGRMTIKNPLVPQLGHELIIDVEGTSKSLTFTRKPTYQFQLEAFVAAIQDGAPLWTDADDGAKQMAVIDDCYRAAGLPIRGLDDV